MISGKNKVATHLAAKGGGGHLPYKQLKFVVFFCGLDFFVMIAGSILDP